MNIRTMICASCVGLAFSAGALAGKGNMGDNDYACQVQTASQVFGLVMAQADNKALAKTIATRAEATNMEGKRESVQHVIECIQIPGETFADKNFWEFFRDFPR